ncbi:hypothetical protein [Micromonospora sp. NPDC023644]|uniref:hypothetical protein n=1 Tax=Micromonospora sp. NPDC023644 TaxID=3154321 RepID=UPI00340C2AB5
MINAMAVLMPTPRPTPKPSDVGVLGPASINWDTVATSVVAAALTAVFVTLAIEYFAKPRLEARKERILQYHKARRDGRRHLLKMREVSIRLSHHQRLPNARTSKRDAHRELYARFNAELLEAINGFDQAFTDVAPDVPTRLYAATTGYLGLVLGVASSDRPWAWKGAAVGLVTLHMIDVWDTSTRRRIRWRRRIGKLEEVIDLYRRKQEFEALVDEILREKLPN